MVLYVWAVVVAGCTVALVKIINKAAKLWSIKKQREEIYEKYRKSMFG